MAGRAATAPLIGRTAELEALRAAYRHAAGGQMGAALIAGDAGVGKSRLAGELAAALPEGEAFVLVGHCLDLGEHEIPYAPVIGALRALPGLLEASELEEVVGPARGELAWLVPGLGEASGTSGSATGAFARARLFELLLGVLGRLAARRPVLLMIEDLHWADGSTRDLVRFLVRSASTERLLLVLTYRSDDLHREHPARSYLAELARDPRVTHMVLRPFSRDELADHVLALRGALPSAAVLDELFARSEGNAFFAEELLSAAGTEDAGRLPRSLRDAMLVRVERLPARTQEILRVVAVAGRRVDSRLLSATAGISEQELAATLREAVDTQVLVPHGRAYEFRHALLREATYAEVLPGEREALHARLAAELEARPELAGAGTALHAELAHHWHAAGVPERALAASVQAGLDAERVYAHPEALRHFQRALELAERLPDEVDRVALSDRAARAAHAVGEYDVAVALGRRAIELAGDAPAGLLHARLAAYLEHAGSDGEARAVSARALALMGPERTAERAQVLEAHARLLLLAARIEEARPPIEEAIAIARELDRPAILASALTTQVIAFHGRTDAAVAAGEAALAAARDAGEPEALLRAYVNAAEALDQAGRVDAAIALALEGADVARRVGAERGVGALLTGDAARRLIKLGRFDEAAERAQAALRLAPSGPAASMLHQAEAALAAHRGDAESAERAIRLARANASGPGGGQWIAGAAAASAELALWRGDPAAAWTLVERALDELADAEFYLYSAPLYALGAWAQVDLALRARALRRDADVAAVRALRARFDAQLVADAPPEPAAHRAQLDAELGRLDEPPNAAAWEATRRRWEVLGFRFHAAVCAWREAEARLAGGDRARAAELLGTAAADARSLRAQPLLEEAEALARRARIALAGAPDERGSVVERTGLSPRELDVLALLADGRTNREIAGALFISEKTVSVHVSRILAKLGAGNRAEAAAIAHRLGLVAAK